MKVLDKILNSPKTLPFFVGAVCIGFTWFMVNSISNEWDQTVDKARSERVEKLEAAEKKRLEIKKNCKLSTTEKQFDLKGNENTTERYSCADGADYSFSIPNESNQ